METLQEFPDIILVLLDFALEILGLAQTKNAVQTTKTIRLPKSRGGGGAAYIRQSSVNQVYT